MKSYLGIFSVCLALISASAFASSNTYRCTSMNDGASYGNHIKLTHDYDLCELTLSNRSLGRITGETELLQDGSCGLDFQNFRTQNITAEIDLSIYSGKTTGSLTINGQDKYSCELVSSN